MAQTIATANKKNSARWRRFTLATLLIFAAVTMLSGVRGVIGGEEEIETRNQIYELIKALNNTYQVRKKFVDEIAKYAAGKDRNIVMSQLARGLSLNNIQITEGVIEIYARLNDPSVIPLLHNTALYDPALDARRSVIYHLPLFYVREPRTQGEIRDFFEQMERFLPERLLLPLREPPIENGKFNHVRDKLRQDIEQILVEQLEPIGAVMNYLETTHQAEAHDQLKQFLGIDLGNNKNKWLEFWRGRGRIFVSPVQDDLFDTQTSAAQLLAMMGAEATPALCEQIRWIAATPFAIIRGEVLQMLSELLRVAVGELREHHEALAKGIADQPEEIWRKRRIDAAQRLHDLTFELAKKYLTADSSLFNLLLIDCLGETRDAAAMNFLRAVLRSGATAFELSQHLALAFGKIGDSEAVKLLTMMIDYQGIAVERDEQIREYQRIRASTQALATIAGEFHHDEFRAANSETADAASELLFERLTDSRGIIGAPDRGKTQTVQYLTRKILCEQWRTNERSYNPETWRIIYQQMRSQKNETKVKK